jgi:hypothetical protein
VLEIKFFSFFLDGGVFWVENGTPGFLFIFFSRVGNLDEIIFLYRIYRGISLDNKARPSHKARLVSRLIGRIQTNNNISFYLS